VYYTSYGRVAERLKAPVLKTGEVQASVGSNPTPSAITESWLSGLKHLTANETNQKVPRVRISHSPPTLWGRGEIGIHSRLKICGFGMSVRLRPSLPIIQGLIAQMVEQLTLNQRVVGSIPSQFTNYDSID
jgi:hypothetical protein